MSDWSHAMRQTAAVNAHVYRELPRVDNAKPAAALVFAYDNAPLQSGFKCPCCSKVLTPIEFIDFYRGRPE